MSETSELAVDAKLLSKKQRQLRDERDEILGKFIQIERELIQTKS